MIPFGSKLGNGSFRVEVRDAKHVDQCSSISTRVWSHQPTSDLKTCLLFFGKACNDCDAKHADQYSWRSTGVWLHQLTSDRKRCLLFWRCLRWLCLKAFSVPTLCIGGPRGQSNERLLFCSVGNLSRVVSDLRSNGKVSFDGRGAGARDT